MRRTLYRILLFCAVISLLSACQPIRPADQLPPAPAPMQQTLTWDKTPLDMKIANAMSGGPMAIAQNATIMDWPTDASGGEWITLREGSNGWVCTPDDWGIANNTPTNDPQCLDQTWWAWQQAVWLGEEPNVTQPGVAYMLQGGSAANNDLPQLAPNEGDEWQVDPIHVMFLFPKGSDLSAMPSDMHMGMPYVMFTGTPYDHIMAPIEVESLEPVEPGTDVETRIANAMSAAPTEIGKDATIIDWPTDGTANFPVLREGTNGWTCIPDDNILPSGATLTNDPMCLDAMWVEWLTASFEGREPNITAPGISYMLQGGSVAHNDDPTVTTVPEGGEWQIDPPHIMILSPGGFDENAWSNDHSHGGPYIMFGGTPYEHLMIPVDPVVTGKVEHSHTMSHDIQQAEALIDAFYSFDPARLEPFLDSTPEGKKLLLFYQGWAQGGNYTIVKRTPCVEIESTVIRCAITVKDDLMMALGIDFNVTDSFHLTFDDDKIIEVKTTSNDLPVFSQAIQWVWNKQAALVTGPCQGFFEGGPTPGDCVRGMVEGFKLFATSDDFPAEHRK